MASLFRPRTHSRASAAEDGRTQNAWVREFKVSSGRLGCGWHRAKPLPSSFCPRPSQKWFWKGCKPNFVCALADGENHLSEQPVPETRRLRALKRAASRFPIWPCTRWGFPCPCDYSSGGGLLHHLFTLTAPHVATRRGGMFSVALSVGKHSGFPPACIPAEYASQVTRHRALWSSDFPPPACAGSDSPPFQNQRQLRPRRPDNKGNLRKTARSRLFAGRDGVG